MVTYYAAVAAAVATGQGSVHTVSMVVEHLLLAQWYMCMKIIFKWCSDWCNPLLAITSMRQETGVIVY